MRYCIAYICIDDAGNYSADVPWSEPNAPPTMVTMSWDDNSLQATLDGVKARLQTMHTDIKNQIGTDK